jgi:hypothetical protein
MAAKPEGKISLARPSRRSDNNIKMDLKQDAKLWPRFTWLSVGTIGRLL